MRQSGWLSSFIRALLVTNAHGPVHVATQCGETKFTWVQKIAVALGLDSNLVSVVEEEHFALRPAETWLLVERLNDLGISSPRGAEDTLAMFR